MGEQVWVTGLGAVSAFGTGREKLWSGLVAGESGIGPITLYDAAPYAVRIAGEVSGHEPAEHFDRKTLRRLGRFSQFGLLAAREAVEQSGLVLGDLDPLRVATVVGSGIGDFEMIEDQVVVSKKRGPGKMNPFTVPRVITNMAGANIALEFGLNGPSFGTSSACATGAHAIAMAVLMLRAGIVDVAIAGAAEACVSPVSVESYHALRALSTREVPPEGASCPFDRDRDGFVIAEGAGVLLLEREEFARQRGATPLAALAGVGMTCDAYHITACPPDGKTAAAAMSLALEDAGLTPADIDYVNAHGTSTPLNDPAETRALKLAFGDEASATPMSSTKSMTGHPLGAAGALEAVISISAIREQVIPPTINLRHPDPACDLDYVPNTARDAKIGAVMSNSFGFGGQNCVLVARSV
jgi:3-oxoacyl-[acyl-carrier-protein] synthase II